MNNCRTIALCTALLAAAAIPSARADEKPFLRASLASFDSFNTLILGFNHKLPALRADIEQHFQLQPGALDPSRPFGFVVVSDRAALNTPGGAPGQAAVVNVLPVLPGKSSPRVVAPPPPDPHHDDLLDGPAPKTAGWLFRSTPDHLLVNTLSDRALSLVDPDVFKNDYPSPDILAAATLNLAALRSADSGFYQSRLLPNRYQPLLPLLQSINRISLQVTHDKGAFNFKTWWLPTSLHLSAAHPRPAFPADGIQVTAQLHLAFAHDQAGQWIDTVVPALVSRNVTGVLPLLHVLGSGDAVSIAVGSNQPYKHPIVFIVSQVAAGDDVAAAFTQAWTTFAGNDTARYPLTTYSLNGKTVSRATFPAKPPMKHYNLDLLQDGSVVYAALSDADDHFVENLHAAGMKGQLPAGTLLDGSANVFDTLVGLSVLTGFKAQSDPEFAAPFRPFFSHDPITLHAEVDPDGKFVYANLQLTDFITDVQLQQLLRNEIIAATPHTPDGRPIPPNTTAPPARPRP